MSNNVILVDVDEVLADFQSPSLKIMGEVTGRNYTLSDFKTWDIFEELTPEERDLVFDQIKQPGYATQLAPTPGSQEFVRELSKLGTLYIVTSPFASPTWVYDRTKWLWDHFGIPSKRVVSTSAKHLVRGRALLDDKPEHVDLWQEHHPDELAMLWHIPNTTLLPHPNRVTSWSEVLNRVERHLCR